MDANLSIVILMSTYNGQKFLAEQLQSIAKQTFKNWRVVLSDDGSNDDTLLIAHLDVDLRSEMRALREDMDKRFEQMQAEKARRFDQLTSRMDHYMTWSFTTTLTVGGIVIAAIKFL